MKADILREKFLDFFKARKHRIVDSDSLVPKDDPTVLFTPAGMNQFKKEFLGIDSGFTRAASSQRCLRTDDLDKVGKTSSHHTFFEMLGNFSFGDYFKREAISWAWEFLTQVLKIDKERLWVSVYKDDNEAYAIWRDLIKVPEKKIIKLGDKENFWPSEAKAKGPNGPCGPCSEIFYDQGQDSGCGSASCDPVCGCGRFFEVWNLVFTQFNRKEGGILEPLPKKNIDTGMGLERLSAVMQGVSSNFETDLFIPILNKINSEVSVQQPDACKSLMHAIADHIRAIVFSIYDGVLPSNEGRGYVVRKVIRKSILHLRALGIKGTFLHKLVPVLAQVMRAPYPELGQRKDNISQIILAEEKSFISTLSSSEILFKEKFEQFAKNPDPESAGAIAFQLYDTHGIPLELTKEWLDKKGISFSEKAYKRELESQKERSKSQSAMKGDVFSKGVDYGARETKFTGYKDCSAKAKILKIFKDSSAVKKVAQGESALFILDTTPFYAESGGQVGDTGEIIKAKSCFEVLDTKQAGKIILHIGRVKSGSFSVNASVLAKVNAERRLAIARNHTATHLLQAALRQVLGAHVHQQGSLVEEERLRFDFTHFKDIAREELDRIEELVNAQILSDTLLEVKEKTLAEAKKSGALAFFAEKYEGRVRVVSVGDFSKELCGGTHLRSTGQIGFFRIIQEGSVAQGIRRIEAATGKNAYKIAKGEEAIINELASSLNVSRGSIIPELQKKISRLKELEKQLNAHRLDSVKSGLDDLIDSAQQVNNIKLLAKEIDGLSMDLLRKNVDMIKQRLPSAIICLGSNSNGRALLVLALTDDLCSRGMDASLLIRAVAEKIGGSGGGRKDFAQAGGDKPQNFSLAFEELRKKAADIK